MLKQFKLKSQQNIQNLLQVLQKRWANSVFGTEIYTIWFPNFNLNTKKLWVWEIMRIRISISIFSLHYSNTIKILNYSLTSVLQRSTQKDICCSLKVKTWQTNPGFSRKGNRPIDPNPVWKAEAKMGVCFGTKTLLLSLPKSFIYSANNHQHFVCILYCIIYITYLSIITEGGVIASLIYF